MRLVNLFSIAFWALVSSFLALPAQATSLLRNNQSVEEMSQFAGSAGFENGSKNMLSIGLAEVLKAWFGLLGIIFLVLVLIAGYNWMTAGGETGKVDTAKKLLTNAAIGFLITVSAYAITYFVFSSFSFK